jgi:NAD(P)H-hydrate epimerase
LITPKLAQSIDKWTIETVGVPSFTLMELAGSKAASQLLADFPNARNILVLVGKGNNAGDGLVMARHLLLSGHQDIEITISLVFDEPPTTVDAKKNWELLTSKTHSSIHNRIRYLDSTKLRDAKLLDEFDVCIDAIFGVGLSRAIDEPLSACFNSLNLSKLPIVALDVPSGLNAEDGSILGTAIHASHTYTFGFDKVGFYVNDAKKIAGTVKTLALGYDINSFLKEHRDYSLYSGSFRKIESKTPKFIYSKKETPKHKYDGGAVLILGSSVGLTGATISVAQAAWAAGTSAIFIIIPKALSSIFEVALPFAIKWVVGDENDEYLTEKHHSEIHTYLDSYGNKGAICIGPGLGQNPSTLKLVDTLIQKIAVPLVLDADALKALNTATKFPKNTPIVITPHLGEWQSIQMNYSLNESAKSAISLESIADIVDFAINNELHLIRKGNPTIYCNGVNSSSDSSLRLPYLTSAPQLQALFNKTGFGDVLSGLIASALVRFSTTEEAIIWSLQIGLQAAEACTLEHKKFYPETIIDFVKSQE